MRQARVPGGARHALDDPQLALIEQVEHRLDRLADLALRRRR